MDDQWATAAGLDLQTVQGMPLNRYQPSGPQGGSERTSLTQSSARLLMSAFNGMLLRLENARRLSNALTSK